MFTIKAWFFYKFILYYILMLFKKDFQVYESGNLVSFS